MSPFLEAKLASLVAAGGLGWCVYLISKSFTSIADIKVPTGGPAEVIALGVVLWLHAKYRTTVEIR